MPRIKVVLPFKVRFAAGEAMREFPKGEHDLTEKEVQNWYVQGCIQDERAFLLSEDGQTAAVFTLEAAFARLGEGDFRKDGVPTVAAMEKLLGRDVVSAEIEAAWDKYQAANQAGADTVQGGEGS